MKTLFFQTFFVVVFSTGLISCAHHSNVVLFNQNSSARTSRSTGMAKVPAEKVSIYRSQIPFKPFEEIGLVTIRSDSFDLEYIHNRLRSDAAEHGAQAVVSVKTKGETHTEWVTERKCETKNECDLNGVCTPHEDCHDEQVPQEVTTFLTEGSMIRRKK
jgi:hypothetical protein